MNCGKFLEKIIVGAKVERGWVEKMWEVSVGGSWGREVWVWRWEKGSWRKEVVDILGLGELGDEYEVGEEVDE